MINTTQSSTRTHTLPHCTHSRWWLVLGWVTTQEDNSRLQIAYISYIWRVIKFTNYNYKLNFNEHVQYVTKKVNASLSLLRSQIKTTWGASKTVLLTLYKALVESQFAYGSKLLYSASEKKVYPT